MAIAFDATSGEYLAITSSPPNRASANGYTFMGWFNLNSSHMGTSVYQTFYHLDDTASGSSGRGDNVYLNNRTLTFYGNNGSGDISPTFSGWLYPNDDQWHHLAIVRNGSSVLAYLDGEYQSSISASDYSDPSQAFYVGSWATEGDWLHGDVAYVRFWETVLTEKQIQTEMYRANPANLTGLYGNWRTPSDSDRANDTSGNTNHFTLTGSAGDVANPFTVSDSAKIAMVTVAANTSTGTQDVTTTDLGGLTPKACWVQWSYATANDTITDHQGFGVGASDGTTTWSLFTFSQDNVTSKLARRVSSAALVILSDPTVPGTTTGKALFSQWLTNGVRLNWTTAPPAGYLLTFVFFAGDLIAATAGQETGTATSTQYDVDAGFEPDFFLGAMVPDDSGEQFNDTYANYGHPNLILGANTSPSLTLYCASARIRGATWTNPSDNAARMSTTYFGKVTWDSANWDTQISLDAFNDNGWSYTMTYSRYASYAAYGYLAVKILNHNVVVGADSTPTTNTDRNLSVGFNPQWLMLFGASDGTTRTSHEWSSSDFDGIFAGHATSTSNEKSLASNNQDGAGTSEANSLVSTGIFAGFSDGQWTYGNVTAWGSTTTITMTTVPVTEAFAFFWIAVQEFQQGGAETFEDSLTLAVAHDLARVTVADYFLAGTIAAVQTLGPAAAAERFGSATMGASVGAGQAAGGVGNAEAILAQTLAAGVGALVSLYPVETLHAVLSIAAANQANVERQALLGTSQSAEGAQNATTTAQAALAAAQALQATGMSSAAIESVLGVLRAFTGGDVQYLDLAETLSSAIGLGPSAQAGTIGDVDLGLLAGLLALGEAVGEAVVYLGIAETLDHLATVNAGAVYNETLTLGEALALQAMAQAVLHNVETLGTRYSGIGGGDSVAQGSGSVGNTLAVLGAGGRLLDSLVNFAHTLDLASTAGSLALESAYLGSTKGAGGYPNVVALAQSALSKTFTLSPLAGQTFFLVGQLGLDWGLIAQTILYADLPPLGRRFTVAADRRLVTVSADNRILTVE